MRWPDSKNHQKLLKGIGKLFKTFQSQLTSLNLKFKGIRAPLAPPRNANGHSDTVASVAGGNGMSDILLGYMALS